jgi:hypothetical protein
MTGCKPPQQLQTARHSKPIKCKDMDATNQPQWRKTPYGHSISITELLTWVHGRMGLVALHDRVQTTTTTSDCKIFTANKVQRYGCYQPTPMGNTPYGHSIIITELLAWVHGRMGLVALHDRVQTPQQPQTARYSQPIKCKDMDATNQHQWGTPLMAILLL